ncbi:MAG: 3'-5' exonuclease [bacterium]|nr:3'-5' exonuclease [bacterium]
MTKFELKRPLFIFDLETTGTDSATDRIVEICVLRIDSDGGREMRTRRINPERPIPPDATAVHGIRDEDVSDQPTFRQVAKGLLDFLGDGDLAGFNVLRFDLPLLEREFRDCGLDLGMDRRDVVDAMTIFHRKNPRDLSAAVRHYLDREHENAHAAAADVEATADILEAQLERHTDLPHSVAELDAWIRPARRDRIDASGKLVWRDGVAVLSFGKHQGKSLQDLVEQQADYLRWIIDADFPDDAKALVARALDGEFPCR